MGLLRRLLGGDDPTPTTPRTSMWESRLPPWMKDGMSVALFEGDDMLEVKGESHHQDELRYLVEHMGREVPAILVPEPENPHDSNAVAVWVAGLLVGHLGRADAQTVQPVVQGLMEEEGEPIALMALILGGDEGRPSLGVFLKCDLEDFGLRSPTRQGIRQHNQEDGGVRTGSEAGSMSWMDHLPTDRLAAIKQLRGLLAKETDPIERHFMYDELEGLLYKCRDVFESALAEYEQTCVAHDAEMDDIVPLLKEGLDGVPALITYKQVAIMKQKEHDFEAALWWVERGLALYGDDGIRDDFVDDLQERAEKYRAKLHGPR